MPEPAASERSVSNAPTSRRRGSLLMSLLLAAGMLAWVVVWLLGTDPGTQRQRLPDGSTLALLGTTFNGRQEWTAGARWQKLLYPVAPSWLQERMGSVTRMYLTNPPPGLLTVWAREAGTPLGAGQLSFCAVDKHGCEFWTRNYGDYRLGPSGSEQLRPIPLELFPRRASEMRVWVYDEEDPFHSRRLAEFAVPNPDPGPHPNWPVPPLPQSVTRDGFTFTLDRLVTGLQLDDETGPVPDGEGACSRFDYRITRDGRPLKDWTVASMAWSDATGNHAETSEEVSVTSPLWARSYGWVGGLCTHEPYRLHVEFTAPRILDASDTWSLNTVQVPPLRVARPVNWSAERYGTQLHVAQLAGSGARPQEWNVLNYYWPKATFIVVTGLRPGVMDRLRLTRVVDAHGQRPQQRMNDGQPFSFEDGTAFFGFRSAPGVRSVDLTFSLRRSCFVDFVARPVPAPDGTKRSH